MEKSFELKFTDAFQKKVFAINGEAEVKNDFKTEQINCSKAFKNYRVTGNGLNNNTSQETYEYVAKDLKKSIKLNYTSQTLQTKNKLCKTR